MSERIVFDTEPLVAHLHDEDGADTVEDYLNRVEEGDITGFVSPVTLTEVKYISERSEMDVSPDLFIEWLHSQGVRRWRLFSPSDTSSGGEVPVASTAPVQ